MTTPRILIVEDDGLIALEIAERLKHLSYDVIDAVATGEEAINCAEKTHPDLILMDIRLRGSMDGTEAAQHITSKEDTPVIYITAYSDNETRANARRTFSYGYIVKPFTDQQLLCAIDMAFSNHALHRKLKEHDAKFKALFENTSDAGFLMEFSDDKEKCRITEVNRAACTLLGYTPDELVGKDMAALNDRCCNQEYPEYLTKLITDGSVRYEMILVGKNGKKPFVEINAHTFPFGDRRMVISLAREVHS